MKRFIAPLIVSTALIAGGCGPETGTNYENDITVGELLDASDMFKKVAPGGSILIQSENDDEIIDDITSVTKLIEVQYPNGVEDEDAPIIGDNPQRIIGLISNADGTEFNNDLACDTLRINMDGFSKSHVYIGALALSDSRNDEVLVSWPLDGDNEPSEYAQVCFDGGHEAKHGIVLAVMSNK